MFEDPAGYFEAHPDAMLIIDPLSDAVLRSNNQARKLFGCSDEKLVSGTSEAIGLRYEKNTVGDVVSVQLIGTSNSLLDVQFQAIGFDGRAAMLITFRDFSHLDRVDERGRLNLSGQINGLCEISHSGTAPKDPAQELDQRLSEMIDGITDAFLTLDLDSNFTFLNSAAESLLGRSRADLIGRNIWEEFPETIGSRFHSEYVNALAKAEKTHFVEYSDILKRMFSVTAYPASGGLAIFCRDVSDQYARDQQLALLETAVSRLNDIVFIFTVEQFGGTKDAKMVFANDSFLNHTGYGLDEIIGQSPRLLDGPRTQVSEMDRLDKALQSAQSVRSEFINYTKGGHPYWVEMEMVPIDIKDSDNTHWVAVERDITDRKRAEDRVVISEERFQLISLATKVVIWDCDLQTDTIWWNDNLFDVFGHKPTAHEERATWWDENLHPEEKLAVQERIQAFVDGQETLWELQYRFLKADGSFAHVADKGSIIRDSDGKAIRILGSMNDVSDQIRLDEQLRQSQKLEAIGQLTGGVAHDFNNLLAIILGNFELLQLELESTNAISQATENLLKSGKSAVLRGADLSNSMLAYARKSQLEPEETDLNDVVVETEKWIRRTIESNVDIETQLQPDLWKIRVDPSSLQNAIINLLVNSRDALEEGGDLVIKTRNVPSEIAGRSEIEKDAQANACVMLEVTDNGAGMDRATLEQIFTPFFTTKPIGKGSGLGLSMVQGFVQQSGGKILVTSEPGFGTQVRIFFEASLGDALDSEKNDAQPVNQTIGKSKSTQRAHRILVAEDEPEVMTIIKRILENEGYDVTTAVNGDDGYKIFKQDRSFDLILTDITMPGELQGDGLADACRKLCPDIPVIFLSGYAKKPGSQDNLIQTGSIRLIKPILRADLVNAIAAQLST